MVRSRGLNRLRARRGALFQDRPRICPVLDDAHLEDRMTYTHTQPVHHGLVERAEDWPGISSFRAVCDGKSSLDIVCFDERAWREDGALQRRVRDFTQTISVPLAMPKKWRRLSTSELRRTRRAHEQSVRARELDMARERRAATRHRRVPTVSQLLKRDPFSRPETPKVRTPQPWAHAFARDEQQYRRAYAVMLQAYRGASARFRETGTLCAFPQGTRPPWIRFASLHS